MYNQSSNIDITRLAILLTIDTILALIIAYKQHKEYGYKFSSQFIKVWIGIAGLSFIVAKIF